ncbi:MAG: hypothetical protein ACRDD2_09730 [Sarcina sp.]
MLISNNISNVYKVISNESNFSEKINGKQFDKGKALETDKLELSEEALTGSHLNPPEEIKIIIPRSATIGFETGQARSENIKYIVEESERLNLSFDESIKFFREESQKWVDGLKDNDPEMYEAWIRSSRYYIERGTPELAYLPKDFTMEDYAKYNDSFEAWA